MVYKTLPQTATSLLESNYQLTEVNNPMQDLETKIRIALGELGATWEDPEMVIQDILTIVNKEISLAVEQEKGRILEAIKKEQEKTRLEQFTVDTIITLINNK